MAAVVPSVVEAVVTVGIGEVIGITIIPRTCIASVTVVVTLIMPRVLYLPSGMPVLVGVKDVIVTVIMASEMVAVAVKGGGRIRSLP